MARRQKPYCMQVQLWTGCPRLCRLRGFQTDTLDTHIVACHTKWGSELISQGTSGKASVRHVVVHTAVT